jgi:hypothetical protein
MRSAVPAASVTTIEGLPVFLTIHEVSELSRRSVNALHQLRHVGRGPAARKVDGRLLYKSADVLAWMEGDAED